MIGLRPSPIIFAGDLNADPTTRNGALLRDFAESNFLTIHIEEPTRITEHSANILDQFLSNVPNLVKDVNVDPPLATNDHCTISLTLNFKVHNQANYTRHIWNYKHADFVGLNNSISNYDWDLCFEGNDFEEILNRWNSSFLNLARESIPNKYVTIRPKDVPWFNAELRKLRKDKNKAHRQAKSLNTPLKWNDFRKARNTYVGKLREAEENYKKNLASDLQNPSNITPKKWWHITKMFLNKSNKTDIPPIVDETTNTTHSEDNEKAKMFNEAFSEFSKIDATNAVVPQLINLKTESTLSEINVSINEVKRHTS